MKLQTVREMFDLENLLIEKVGLSIVDAREAVGSLRRLALAIDRHNERQCSNEYYCNGHEGCAEDQTPSAIQDRRLDKRVANLEKRYGLKLLVQGDPRGPALRVLGIGHNTWGGEDGGYAVPT